MVGVAELEAMGRVMREDGYLGMGRKCGLLKRSCRNT